MSLRESDTTAPENTDAAVVGDRDAEAARAWERSYERFNVQKDWLGQTFTVRGTEYRVTGLNPRRPKFPVTARRGHDDRGFKFPVNTLKMAFLLQAAP